jgi:hypothetical protein
MDQLGTLVLADRGELELTVLSSVRGFAIPRLQSHSGVVVRAIMT